MAVSLSAVQPFTVSFYDKQLYSTPVSNNITSYYANSPILPNGFIAFSLSTTSSCMLYASVAVGTQYLLDIYDSNGNFISSISSTTLINALTLTANSNYVIVFRTASAISANAVLFSLAAYKSSTTTDFFTNGIVPVVTPSSALSYTINANGNVTFTFNNYVLSENAIVSLATLDNALQNGSVNVTSSDTSVFVNRTFGFTVGEFLSIKVIGLKSTVFSGTVTVSIVGVGSTTPLNFTSFTF